MTKFIDKLIDFAFSKDARKYLIGIFLIGIVLRFIVITNISALGDEMVHGPHAIGFLNSGLISTIAHSPLWFYLTDIAMRFLGVTIFSTRFLSFFYGSLSILLVFLISSHIFNKRVGLISAFLLSISYFTIRYSLIEMDVSALFFILMAMYLFIISAENKKFPFFSALSLGTAALIKTLSLFFVPAFLIAFFLFDEKKDYKKSIKNIILFGILIALLFSPILIHNYLWYKDKGMVDIYFAQYFNIGKAREAYAGQLGYASGFLEENFFKGILTMSKTIFTLDPLIVSMAIFGIILSFSMKDKRKYWIFLISFQLFGFFFLVLSNWLPTHYVTLMPVLSIFAAFFIDKFSLSFKGNEKNALFIILLAIFLIQVYFLLPHLTSKCAICKMRNYAISSMDKSSLVIVDARIYRGRIAWLFNDFHYLESSFFPQFLQLNQNISGQDMPVKTYFIECVRDDCGWGTITSGPLNDTSEQMVMAFSQQSSLEKTILGGGGYDEETGKPYFRIYSTTLAFKPQILQLVDSTHDWFYYPLHYKPKEKIFDNYSITGLLDNLIYLFAWSILIISIILAFIFPIILIYNLFKK